MTLRCCTVMGIICCQFISW